MNKKTSPTGFEPIDTAPVSIGRLAQSLPGQPRGFLVVLRGPQAGSMFPVRGHTILGRGAEVTTFLDDTGASRQHASIELTQDRQFVINDLGSRNGTRVNGETITRRRLVNGDRVEIGTATLLKFVIQDPLEIQVQEAQRLEALGRLAGNLAHEFNNLLTVVINNLEHLRRVNEGSQDALECLDDSLFEARRGAQLTRNLLAFARRGPFDPKPIDLGGVIETFVRLFERMVHEKISVVTKRGDRLDVVGDSAQLHQVLLNLGINAQDAMLEGGEITVEAVPIRVRDGSPQTKDGIEPGDYVLLRVSDNGTGMTAQTRMQIFEPFFTTKEGGTGLGLAVVDSIIRGHNGTVLVESKVNQGTTFSVYLPAAGAQPPRDVPEHTVEFSPPSGTVLVVDDDDAVRRSIKRLLTASGFEVEAVGSGADAVAASRSRAAPFNLALVDLAMPQMDGVATIRELRALVADLPVVLMTGRVNDPRLDEISRSEKVDLLLKPFERSALLEALKRAGVKT